MATDLALSREQAIEHITRRLVEYFHPERIYLFGSVARGDDGPDSDLDFEVVLPDDAPQELYRPGIHRALWDLGTACDVLRWPATQFEGLANHARASLPASIMREGRVLYDAGKRAA